MLALELLCIVSNAQQQLFHEGPSPTTQNQKRGVELHFCAKNIFHRAIAQKAKMPKGRVLTPAEREEITRLHAGGASAREIGKQLSRSKTVVLNFLKAPTLYAQTKRSGRKRALSGDDERRLHAALVQRLALAEGGVESGSPRPDAKRSAEQIRREFNVPLSTRRIQQLLSEWRREARRAQDRQQQEPTSLTAASSDSGRSAAEPVGLTEAVASASVDGKATVVASEEQRPSSTAPVSTVAHSSDAQDAAVVVEI